MLLDAIARFDDGRNNVHRVINVTGRGGCIPQNFEGSRTHWDPSFRERYGAVVLARE